MALSIRRGTSKLLQLTLENCNTQDYIWSDFGSIRVRLSQGSVCVDKFATIDYNDETACFVYYSQEDTIKFSDKYKAKLQVFVLNESLEHQVASKSSVFDVIILESLWDNVVTDGRYGGVESLVLEDPDYPEPIGHDYYGYLHIDIKEYRGIITEFGGATLEGSFLVYDPSTETVFSEET